MREAQKQSEEAIRKALIALSYADRGSVRVLAEHIDWLKGELDRTNHDRHEEIDAIYREKTELQRKLDASEAESDKRYHNLMSLRAEFKQLKEAKTECFPPAPVAPCRTCGSPLTPDHTLATGHQEAL